MAEISKHPEMGNIITSIRKIAEDIPCDKCSTLKDDLNAAKSREKHWKDKYDEISTVINESIIPRDLMRQLFGGVFPHDDEFDFEQISEWRYKSGKWYPYEAGNQLPGPSLKIPVEITPTYKPPSDFTEDPL